MLQGHSFQGREVVTAVDWDDMKLRNLRLPTMPEEEVAEALLFEASERFNIDPANTELRHIIAGDVRQGNDIRQEVIVMAVDRDVIDSRIAQLTHLGLTPVAMDAPFCALFRNFERFLRRQEDADLVNVFVDIGYAASRVLVSRGDKLIFVKSIPIGGRRFDELFAEHMNLDPNEAAQLQNRNGISTSEKQHGVAASAGNADANSAVRRAMLDAIRPAVTQLGKEIGLCVRYCSVTFRGPRSQTITVVGGAATNGDMLQMLSDQMSLPFRQGQPAKKITLESPLATTDRRTGQPEWATVLGLALRPISHEVAAA